MPSYYAVKNVNIVEKLGQNTATICKRVDLSRVILRLFPNAQNILKYKFKPLLTVVVPFFSSYFCFWQPCVFWLACKATGYLKLRGANLPLQNPFHSFNV